MKIIEIIFESCFFLFWIPVWQCKFVLQLLSNITILSLYISAVTWKKMPTFSFPLLSTYTRIFFEKYLIFGQNRWYFLVSCKKFFKLVHMKVLMKGVKKLFGHSFSYLYPVVEVSTTALHWLENFYPLIKNDAMVHNFQKILQKI